MKTMPTALFRGAILLVGVLGLLAIVGCRTPRFFGQSAPPTSPPPGPVAPVTNASQQALDTVTTYVTALERLDYAAAYALLSRASQAAHTRAAFETQGKVGLPSYDLASARSAITGDHAMVTVNLADEAGEHSFALVREAGAWKIEFAGGRPGMPYPASTAGEKSHESHP